MLTAGSRSATQQEFRSAILLHARRAPLKIKGSDGRALRKEGTRAVQPLHCRAASAAQHQPSANATQPSVAIPLKCASENFTVSVFN